MSCMVLWMVENWVMVVPASVTVVAETMVSTEEATTTGGQPEPEQAAAEEAGAAGTVEAEAAGTVGAEAAGQPGPEQAGADAAGAEEAGPEAAGAVETAQPGQTVMTVVETAYVEVMTWVVRWLAGQLVMLAAHLVTVMRSVV